MKIQSRQQAVYFAPTARRTFITKRAAASAEARAQIRKKYPTERGDIESPGYHWRHDLPNADKIHRRLMRRILHQIL